MKKAVLIFAWVLFLCSLVQAAEPIGLITGLEGPVVVTDAAGTARNVKIQSRIFLNDTVVTGAKAKLEIMFIDDTRFSLGENSEMTLDEYVYNPDKKTGNKFGAKLKQGIFHTITGKIPMTDPDGFKVKTSRSTIGIRGCVLGFEIFQLSENILIIEISPGNWIFVSTLADPQGRTFENPCALTINNEGLIKLNPLTPAMINRNRQSTSPAGRGGPQGNEQGGQSTESGGGDGGWWGNDFRHGPFRSGGWIGPGEHDLPATPI